MRRSMIVLAAALSFAVPALAQQNKFGYVDIEILVQSYPDFETASKTYEREVTAWQSQMKAKQDSLAALEQEYNQKAMLLSPDKKKAMEENYLTRKQAALQAYQDIFGPQGRAKQREVDLLSPLYDKINQAIQTLGKRDGYTMIFKQEGLLFAQETLNITDQVLVVLKAGAPAKK